jgi:hypothetical protein
MARTIGAEPWRIAFGMRNFVPAVVSLIKEIKHIANGGLDGFISFFKRL